MARPQTIADYIEAAAPEARTKLRAMQRCIRAAAPGAAEEIKWSMPAFSSGRILVMFAAFKRHIGFYPTPSVIAAFAKQLTGFKSAKGSIQFPLDQPLPLILIRKMTALRVREAAREDKTWRSSH